MRQPVIHCAQPKRGTLYFFVTAGKESHYLFGLPFLPSLWKRFRSGIPLDNALDRSKYGEPDWKIRDRFLKSISSVEKEYGVSLLRRSRKRAKRRSWDEDRCDETAA